MTKAGMKAHLHIKYIDDVLVVVKTLEVAAGSCNGVISSDTKDILDDLRRGKTMQEVTLDIVRDTANSLVP